MNAQTIHWLTFVDTEDTNVGKLDVTGRNVLYNRFVNVINAALLKKGYNSDVHDIYDSALTPERCKKEVENLQCDAKDIIVFYYIGHGTHAQGECNDYPQMLLGCDFSEQNKFIPLKWVHDELKTKGARLTATIGMCCNVVQTASPKKAPTFSVNYGNIELSDTEIESIQKMFLGYRGDFILSSASVGQSSLGGDTPLGAMDLFTAVLVTNFEDMSYDGSLNWDNLFGATKEIVNSVTNGKQTPFWDNNLTSSSQPTTQPVKTPTPKTVVTKPVQATTTTTTATTVNINEKEAFCNYLTTYFDYMLDEKHSNAERTAKKNIVRELFTSDAKVQLYSQDSNQSGEYMATEKIDDFLGFIKSNMKGLILKVSPFDYEHNGQKITVLKVKESYKNQ